MDNILHLINAYGDPDLEGFAERQFRIETYAKTLSEYGLDTDSENLTSDEIATINSLKTNMGLQDLTSDEIATINSYLN